MQGTQVNWPQGNALLLQVVAPLDFIDPVTPVVMDAADVVEGYMFDKRTPLSVTANAAAATSILALADTSKLLALDSITLRHQDESLSTYEVTSVDSLTSITITGTFDDEVNSGTFIKKCAAGAFPLTGLAYGATPDVLKTDWGYLVEFKESTVPDLSEGMLLEGYVRLEKTSTGAIYSQSWDVIFGTAKGTP